MASTPVLTLLFFMVFANEATAETNHSSIVRVGSWLSPEGNQTSWASSSGHFAFGFYHSQGKGYAVGIWLVNQPKNTIVWPANRDSPPLPSNSKLRLTKLDGLLLQNGEEDPENLTPHVTAKPVASPSMMDSGNFLLYDKDFEVVWSSFEYPTDTILGGQNLTGGRKLVSGVSESDHSSGHFYLIMEYGGSLVAYPMNSSGEEEDAYWSTRGYLSGFEQLSLSIEGSLCQNSEAYNNHCLANSKKLRKISQNTTPIYRATIGEDGNFRLYAHQFESNTISSVQLLWEAVGDICQVQGLCGLNSYCSNMSGKAVCECYPGFVPSKSSGNNTMFLECNQNHKNR